MHKIDLLITLTHDENNENNVTLAFAMGTKAAMAGHKVELLLLSNAVHLGQVGYGDKIDIGQPFEPVKDLIPAFLNAGGKLKICSACMIHNGVKEEDLMEGTEVINADYVVDALMAAEKSFQLN